MVSHHPPMFSDYGQCESGDVAFSVVEEQDSICSSLSPTLLFISKAPGMSGFHTRNFGT